MAIARIARIEAFKKFAQEMTTIRNIIQQECISVAELFRCYITTTLYTSYYIPPETGVLRNIPKLHQDLDSMTDGEVIIASVPSTTGYHYVTGIREGPNLIIFQKFGESGRIKTLTVPIIEFVEVFHRYLDIVEKITTAKTVETITIKEVYKIATCLEEISEKIFGIKDLAYYLTNRDQRRRRWLNKPNRLESSYKSDKVYSDPENLDPYYSIHESQKDIHGANKRKMLEEIITHAVKEDKTFQLNKYLQLRTEKIKERITKVKQKKREEKTRKLSEGDEDEDEEDDEDSDIDETQMTLHEKYESLLINQIIPRIFTEHSNEYVYSIYKFKGVTMKPSAGRGRIQKFNALRMFEQFAKKHSSEIQTRIQSSSSAKFQTKKRKAPRTKKTKRRRK